MIDVEVKFTVGWRFSVDELEDFIEQARDHGCDSVVWSADMGDQREPTQLRFEARRSS